MSDHKPTDKTEGFLDRAAGRAFAWARRQGYDEDMARIIGEEARKLLPELADRRLRELQALQRLREREGLPTLSPEQELQLWNLTDWDAMARVPAMRAEGMSETEIACKVFPYRLDLVKRGRSDPTEQVEYAERLAALATSASHLPEQGDGVTPEGPVSGTEPPICTYCGEAPALELAGSPSRYTDPPLCWSCRMWRHKERQDALEQARRRFRQERAAETEYRRLEAAAAAKLPVAASVPPPGTALSAPSSRGRPRNSFAVPDFPSRYVEEYRAWFAERSQRPTQVDIAAALGITRRTFLDYLKRFDLPWPPP